MYVLKREKEYLKECWQDLHTSPAVISICYKDQHSENEMR